MKNYILRPHSGKTLRMVAISEFNSAPIICVNDAHRKQVVQLAKKYDYRIPFPVTTKELLAGKVYRSSIHNHFLVDEAQDVLAEIVGALTNGSPDSLIGMTTSDDRGAERIVTNDTPVTTTKESA